MRTFTAHVDHETGESSGAGGFQVIDLTDENDVDVMDQMGVDAGQHWNSVDELRKHLSAQLKGEEVEVELD
ncbi:hypothetical protein BHAOGJBA_0696 [Methylobacterium hispanicum]|uniref:Uncharacterized protein n=1 Tax=Methylobacterium hispanicum TaxID=270350 RepID=A0AAV4ZGG3_9HYPH|nr:hypothetical protein [Methylobacterium hispanicum]GJD87196.1 hypothetical protein BHAOGJBA_0696 [Methylobacterium hispanicum]